jgi:hypothetical protein
LQENERVVTRAGVVAVVDNFCQPSLIPVARAGCNYDVAQPKAMVASNGIGGNAVRRPVVLGLSDAVGC